MVPQVTMEALNDIATYGSLVGLAVSLFIEFMGW